MKQIKSYDAYLYRQLYKIVEMKDGCVFKTESTDRHIEHHWDVPEGYIAVPLSTKLTKTTETLNLKMWGDSE